MRTSVGTAHRHKTSASKWSDLTDVLSGSTHTPAGAIAGGVGFPYAYVS